MNNRWTWHGGGLKTAMAHYGAANVDWIDLSTGINPHAWPGAEEISPDWRRLPDEHALRDLEAAAARHFGCDPVHVCAVPGTEIGLRLIGEGMVRPAFHLVPSYRTHGAMIAGSAPVTMEAVADADGATLILANPNNPDGRLWARDRLRDLLDRRGDAGRLIVDEAFVDCHSGASLADRIGMDERLVIFRSFGKFFGLAGLRLGFVLGPQSVLIPLRARLGAWPLSAAALAIGTAAYRDADWIAATRVRLRQEADALDQVLARHGLGPTGSCPLFRLIETTDAMALFERLARNAILTRPFDTESRWLRIGLPASDTDLARLDRAVGDG